MQPADAEAVLRIFLDAHGFEVNLTQRYAERVLRLKQNEEVTSRYVIVNLGWTEVKLIGAAARIRCRPSKLSTTSMINLMFFLADSGVSEISASLFDRDWSHVTFRSLSAFCQYLDDAHDDERPQSALDTRAYLRRAADAGRGPFSEALGQVHLIGMNVERPDLSIALLEKILPARWSIFAIDQDAATSRLLALSNTFRNFDRKWHGIGSGARITEFGDREYGRWIADYHRDVSERRQSAIDFVDAFVALPELGVTRLRYNCITHPVQRPDGSTLLICGAVDDASIDLRKVGG